MGGDESDTHDRMFTEPESEQLQQKNVVEAVQTASAVVFLSSGVAWLNYMGSAAYSVRAKDFVKEKRARKWAKYCEVVYLSSFVIWGVSSYYYKKANNAKKQE